MIYVFIEGCIYYKNITCDLNIIHYICKYKEKIRYKNSYMFGIENVIK